MEDEAEEYELQREHDERHGKLKELRERIAALEVENAELRERIESLECDALGYADGRER